uniref:NADH-ubiquinone oxidoreductase chain 5 n=1 Tax=Ovatella vulcani TaxID=999270 RepID=G8HP98_9EUPU|nr:NADH dehydrogenase subunit 5 [Ovatella vulcani]AEQ93845.1 NADH dehydrogenase subunit 5 [Ovatella vulcani]
MALLSKARFPVLLAFTSALVGCFLWGCYIIESVQIYEYELFALSSVSLSFVVVLDKISLSFGAVVTFISACVFTFACKYMEEDVFFYRFIWILLAFVISMNLLIFSGSVFFLLLGWDGLGITSFALIVYYQSHESLSAGFQTLMANRVGDALIVAGSFLFLCLGQYSYVSVTSEMGGLVLLLCVAATTKSAQYPFSSWLPAAMAAPTPVSALVHSSTLVTAGIYLVIRLSHNVPLSEMSSTLMLLCGAVTCLLGGWAATFENDIKKVIALSTLSQLGVMVFSLGLCLPSLALFHLYTHALFKALLFLAAGAILLTSFGTQDIRLLGGVGLSMPLPMVLFNVSSLCLIGAPFLSAFYSKHLILEMAWKSGTNIVALALMLFATAMTAKYVFRTLKAVAWGKMIGPGVSPPLTLFVSVPMLLLGVGAVAGGKLLTSLDISNTEAAFIPAGAGLVISLVTLAGAVLGLLLEGVRSSYSLSTLFFLAPTFSKSHKMLTPLTRILGAVDYGWAEPAVLFKNLLGPLGSFTSKTFSWPNSPSAFVRLGLSFLLVGIAYTLIF